MGIGLPIIDTVLDTVAGPILRNLFPDPVAREKSAQQLLAAQQQGELDMLKTRLSAILAEANSSDPWTSRARPTFLYVMYLVIVMCIVGSILGIWWPDHVTTAAQNFANLLGAIPDSLWGLFGAGYLGYAASRTYEKAKGVTK